MDRNTFLVLSLFLCLIGWYPAIGQSVTQSFSFDDEGKSHSGSLTFSIFYNNSPIPAGSQRSELLFNPNGENTLIIKVDKLHWETEYSKDDYLLSFLGSKNGVLIPPDIFAQTDQTNKFRKTQDSYLVFKVKGVATAAPITLRFGVEKGGTTVKNNVLEYQKIFSIKQEGASNEVVKNDPPPKNNNSEQPANQVTTPKTEKTPPPPPPDPGAREKASECVGLRNSDRLSAFKNYVAAYGTKGRCYKEVQNWIEELEALQQAKTLDALITWEENYSDSRFKEQAIAKRIQLSPLSFSIDDSEEGAMVVQLDNFVDPFIARISGERLLESIDSTQLKNGILRIRATQDEGLIFQIQDRGKERPNNEVLIDFGQKLEVTLDSSQIEQGRYLFTFDGGSDFLIELRQDNRTRFRKSTLTNELSLELKELYPRQIVGEVQVIARSATSYENMGTIQVPPPPFFFPLPIMILGAVLLGGLLLYLIIRLIQNQQKKRSEAKLKQFQETHDTGTKATTTKEAMLPAKEKVAPVREVPTPPLPPKKEGIRIIKVSKTDSTEKIVQTLGGKTFDELVASGDYMPLDLTTHWGDTSVQTIYLGKQPVRSIDLYLRSATVREGKEQEGKIPEIGGFLMGMFRERDELYYDVLLTEFVPIEAASQNAYMLEFSTESMAIELSNMLERHPTLKVIGWFHTHPGHGLFLSKPDLTIHEGFFQERYQVALEIDSLSENLDTAFFTRSVNGTVNNLEDLRSGADWFHWTEIEKATRRRR